MALMALFVAAVYAAGGALVLQRVRAHWEEPHRVLAVVVFLLWPVVAVGVEVGWLLGRNDWHMRR